ncbi:hypothetical protein ON010_g8080 [Phytophthora cinnamomi]|nr:hypothetical protein ON010_g8080 [Phytophthora cinnamomi]
MAATTQQQKMPRTPTKRTPVSAEDALDCPTYPVAGADGETLESGEAATGAESETVDNASRSSFVWARSCSERCGRESPS